MTLNFLILAFCRLPNGGVFPYDELASFSDAQKNWLIVFNLEFRPNQLLISIEIHIGHIFKDFRIINRDGKIARDFDLDNWFHKCQILGGLTSLLLPIIELVLT